MVLPRLLGSRRLLQSPGPPKGKMLRGDFMAPTFQPAQDLQGPLECGKGPLSPLFTGSVDVLTLDTGSCLPPCHWPLPIPNDLSPLQGWKGCRPVWVAIGMWIQGLQCLSKARMASGHSWWPWSDRWPPYCMTSESELTRTLGGGS